MLTLGHTQQGLSKAQVSQSPTFYDQLTVNKTSNDADPVLLYLDKSRGAAGQDNDYLGQISAFGYNDNASPEHIEYARISTKIIDASDGSEDGQIILSSMYNGGLSASLYCQGPWAGLGTISAGAVKWYIWNDTTAETTRYRSRVASADAQIVNYWRERGGATAGQDNDYLTDLSFTGLNDAGTPESFEYGRISTRIGDASDSSEAGIMYLQVASGGTLVDRIEMNGTGIAFLGASPAAQVAYSESPSNADIRDILIAFGFMAQPS